MTATASSTNGWEPQDFKAQLAPGALLKLTAGASAGYGQNLYFSASLGSVALNDGTVPGLVSAGVCMERLAGPSGVEGGEGVRVHQGVGGYQAASTIANDSFTALDFLSVAFDAGNGVPGKLSNYGGSNRSIMGLVFGVNKDLAPYVWTGPVASLCARALLVLNAFALASFSIADASAGATIAERSIRRPRVKGTITSIVFNGAAIAANNTDYITVTVAKRDGAGGSPVTLGTYDSRAANNGAVTAFVDASFTLSVVAGALNLLETDIVTITVAKSGSGQTITGEFLINGKVI